MHSYVHIMYPLFLVDIYLKRVLQRFYPQIPNPIMHLNVPNQYGQARITLSGSKEHKICIKESYVPFSVSVLSFFQQ